MNEALKHFCFDSGERWVRNRSDELAVEAGCWFDVERGAYTAWWIERYLKLYEGEHAGEPVLLRSGNPDLDSRMFEKVGGATEIRKDWLDWEDGAKELYIQRASDYADWFDAEKLKDPDWQPDWQFECTIRCFGWLIQSKRYNRPIRRFNSASIWVPKKQKKTPTLAAWGTYLTFGDSEPGAKTFSAAKDGGQAKLAMKHAIAMVEQSPELSLECKINKSEQSIYHEGSRSKYEPISSADVRTQKAKEGLNGNLLVDETHVVDRELIARTDRMGISRPEPLHADFSTAGDDPDSYGYDRQQNARMVQAGLEKDIHLFVAIYEAPQDISDSELKADPIKWAKIANPAWGHTAHEEEFLADFNKSIRSIRTFNELKRYRYNIWQRTAMQWLDPDQWEACAEQFNIADFNQQVSLGLDLSKTRDMSALTASVGNNNLSWQTTWLWITRDYMEKWSAKAAFEEWEEAGELVVVEGDTIDYDLIRCQIDEIFDTIGVAVIVYDKTYAQDFIQQYEKKHKKTIYVEFPQSHRDMESPVDEYESKVREGRIRHDDNACLNWQAGHCCVRENQHAQRILAKPKRDDYRKIDGMVTSVMSDWGVQHIPKKKKVFMPVAV